MVSPIEIKIQQYAHSISNLFHARPRVLLHPCHHYPMEEYWSFPSTWYVSMSGGPLVNHIRVLLILLCLLPVGPFPSWAQRCYVAAGTPQMGLYLRGLFQCFDHMPGDPEQDQRRTFSTR